MNNILFSIIVPVYNAEEVLHYNLNNIYFNNDDLQYIFIDDGSTDGSRAILTEFCNSHKNAEYYTVNHSGVSYARNYGIKQAIGRYVLFCDVDDSYAQNVFERLKSEISSQYDIIIFGARINNLSERFRLDDIETSSCKYSKPQVMDSFFNENGTRPYVWNCCYKRDFIIDNNLSFCERLDLGEDMVFQFGAFMTAENISFISDKLYRYNYCTESSANVRYLNNPTERIKKHFEIVKEIDNLYKNNNQNRDEQYAKWILDFLFYDFMALSKKDRKSLMPYIKDLFDSIKLKKICHGFKNKMRRKVLINAFWQFIYVCYKLIA